MICAGIKANLVEMFSADRMNFIMKIHGLASHQFVQVLLWYRIPFEALPDD